MVYNEQYVYSSTCFMVRNYVLILFTQFDYTNLLQRNLFYKRQHVREVHHFFSSTQPAGVSVHQ